MNIEILALLKYGWGLVAAYYWYDKKKQDRVLELITGKLANTPTYDEMEKEIDRSISPLKDDQRETLIMTREMSITLNQLVRDLAVLNAKVQMKNEYDKS